MCVSDGLSDGCREVGVVGGVGVVYEGMHACMCVCVCVCVCVLCIFFAIKCKSCVLGIVWHFYKETRLQI